MTRNGLGPVGVSIDLDGDGVRERAATAERRGASVLWIAGGQLMESLDPLAGLAAATATVRVGSAIAMVDRHDADAVAAARHRSAGRLVAGIGGSRGGRQLAGFSAYFDRLDELGVPPAERMLAALGPRKLALARERSAGAIVLLLTPEHTAWTRAQLGPDAVLVAQLITAIGTDPDAARAGVRPTVGFLADLPGYGAALRRMGFTDHDVTTRSDRLVDGVTAWGSADAVAARARQYLDAGADHVVIDEPALAAGVGDLLRTGS